MTPRIYVADLAAYNNGHLVGEWIDLEGVSGYSDVHEIIESILRRGEIIAAADGQDYVNSPSHEEWAIHDYEGFGPIKIEEFTSIGEVVAHVERMGDDPDRYFAYVEYNGEHYAENYDPDCVIGPWDSMEDIAAEYVEDMGIGEFAERYFDYEKFARDLGIEGSFVEYEGKVYEITY